MTHLKQTIIKKLGSDHFISQLINLDLRQSQNRSLARDYIVGTYRQKCFDSPFRFLVRKHIQEQYLIRIKKARACVERGTCFYCGCKCPDLMFANKGCGLAKTEDFAFRNMIAGRTTPCYYKMLSKKKWKLAKKKLSSWELSFLEI